MQKFTELKVWQRSHALVLKVCRFTSNFPDSERFGLVSQVRRSSASVPTNIAEGSKRSHRKDYARFINVAEGSLAETEYLLLLSGDLGYLSGEAFQELQQEIEELSRMLHALRVTVETFKDR